MVISPKARHERAHGITVEYPVREMSRAGAEIMWAHVVQLNAGSDAAGLEFLQLNCDDSIVRLLTITRGSCLVEWPSAKREWYERRHLRLPAGQGAAELAFDVARLAGWFETMASGLAHGSSNGPCTSPKGPGRACPPSSERSVHLSGASAGALWPGLWPSTRGASTCTNRQEAGERCGRDSGRASGAGLARRRRAA